MMDAALALLAGCAAVAFVLGLKRLVAWLEPPPAKCHVCGEDAAGGNAAGPLCRYHLLRGLD